METSAKYKPYLVRLGIVFTISVVLVVVFNEIVYRFQKTEYDRAPKTINLVIPEGTAKRIEAGEPVTDIPAEMVFVLGDVLNVKNEDMVSHQLGPIWVPPGASGSLVMERANNYSYACSFQNTQYLGLDVRQPTTLGTRLIGVGLAAPTLAALMFLYSIVLLPVDKQKKTREKLNNQTVSR